MQSEPRTLEGGMLVEAEGQIRKGRTFALLAVIGLLCAVVAGLMILMGGDDEQRVFREVGKRINGTKHASFDAYFACLFAGQDPQSFHNNAELSEALVAQAFEIGPPWVKVAQESCAPLLDGAEDRISVLIAPKEIGDNIGTMTRSLVELRTASEEFFSYLAGANGSYDDVIVGERAARLARPWYEFRKAHGEVNQAIKRKMQPDPHE